MARFEIDKVRVRNRLAVRREPYWGAPIARGLFVGFRRLEDGGTWIARQRDDDGKQRYQSIGHADSIPYDDAVKAAHAWAKKVDAGVDTSEVQTVKEACESYVKDRRREVGDANADDAEGRFLRTVYGHSIAKVKLAKLRTEQIKEWRADLDMADASKNRTLSALKAALNFAVASRYVEAGRAIEWERVTPYEVNTRRDLYLNRKQRSALVEKLPEGARAFVRGLCLLPLRPGALAAATVADLDAGRASLRITTDKAGQGRVVALSPEAKKLLQGQAKDKLPAAPLIAYDDGSPWHKERWKQPIKKAAKAAKLPAGVCAYTLRHSVITDMLVGGMDSLTVARMAGTSLAMIEKHYGHLLHEHAAKAMAGLAL
ncbi:tyrosine-type recombinase/integrase [Rhodanobacter sp. 115]|uniref:tyrosine-type recombinase/integrase n=1 Tax=Rhodanobacter sp. FW021-MT20 TaxID=1162282 RepID=UPI000260D258|nr:tyrosine-type recombinase/integrase [Rhodanobacter sp. 115]EIL98234.1 phage integrase family protein [Rhodanobacter sp. 115]